MKLPTAVATLSNRYERGEISLCDLFGTVVKDAEMSRFSHIQGEILLVNLIATTMVCMGF